MSEDRRIVEVEIAVPRDVVWRALRDPAEVRNWFGWEAATLDEEIKTIFVDGARADEAKGIIQFGDWEGVSDRFELSERNGKAVLGVVRHGTTPTWWEAAYPQDSGE